MKRVTLMLILAVATIAQAQQQTATCPPMLSQISSLPSLRLMTIPARLSPALYIKVATPVSERFRVTALRAFRANQSVQLSPSEQKHVQSLYGKADIQRRNQADDAIWGMVQHYRSLNRLLAIEFQNTDFKVRVHEMFNPNDLESSKRFAEQAFRAWEGSPNFKLMTTCREDIEKSLQETLVQKSRCL
jgi:hypothetical protein